MPYDLAEHRHRFAVWAAARAAQRGFTTVANLRKALESVNIKGIIAAPENLQLDEEEFNALHRRLCLEICAFLSSRHIKKTTHGRAAKLVSVYLKATVLMGDACDSPLARNMHPPVDRILLQNLAASEKIKSEHKAAWRSINWTQLNQNTYDLLIDQLRSLLPHGAAFWRIEEYWEPSDNEDTF